MMLFDVNILVYAHRADSPNHAAYLQWLESVINSDLNYGVADMVLSGFLRVVTHPKIFNPPSKMGAAMQFVRQIREQPNCVIVTPGPRHWEIFMGLCSQAGIRGNLVPDAYLAALAIETESEWITTDNDYGRFSGLKWRQPIAP